MTARPYAAGVRQQPSGTRKSHSKSQRGQVSGDTQLRQATVEAGQVPSEPSPATPRDAREVTGGQGVAGSNPAVPTQVRRLIRNSESAFWAFWDQDQTCGHAPRTALK